MDPLDRPDRRGSRLQPVLHPQARHHRAEAPGQPVDAAGGADHLRDRATRQTCTATELVRALGLDAGFLSRTLQALQRRQIVARKPSKSDRRVTELALTAQGPRGVCRTRQPIARRGRGAARRTRCRGARRRGRRHGHDRTGAGAAGAAAGRLPAAKPSPRRHRLGGVAARRALCRRNMAGTSASKRWSPRSARSSSDHSTRRASIAGSPRSAASRSARSSWSGHPTKSRNCGCCWWSKRHAGSGSGARLTEQCIGFARHAGYRSITLWTQSILVAARGDLSARRISLRRTGAAPQFRRRAWSARPGSSNASDGARPKRPWLSAAADARRAAA